MDIKSNRQSSKKMRNFYLYAIGVPTVLTGLTSTIDSEPNFFSNLRYYVQQSCLKEVNVIGRFVYFLVNDVVLIMNIFFCCATAWKIFKVQKQISKLKDYDAKQKTTFKDIKARWGQEFYYSIRKLIFRVSNCRLLMNLKLILMLEITESFELLLTFFGPSTLLKIINIFNKLQGAVIFFLFVCTPKVGKLILAKCKSFKIFSETTGSLNSWTKFSRYF